MAADPPAGTFDQRYAAYQACTQQADQPGNQLGLGAILNGITGDYVGALGDWVKMIINAHPNDCMAVLTPAEQVIERQRLVDLHNQWLIDHPGGHIGIND